MKEFAGVSLASLNMNNQFDRHNAHRAFLEYYKNNCTDSDQICDPGIVIQAVENCIQSNLSLPIDSDEALAITLKYLPDDSDLTSNTLYNVMIRALKLTLKQQGFAENSYKKASLSDRYRIIPHIRGILTIDKDWIQTVNLLCHAVSRKNLDLAAEHLNNIVHMHNHTPQPVSNEQLAMIFGLQISLCISITSYLEHSMGLLCPPFYNHYQTHYVEFMQKLYNVAQASLANSLKKLQTMPDPVVQTDKEYRSHGILTFFRRGNHYARVENSGYTAQYKI